MIPLIILYFFLYNLLGVKHRLSCVYIPVCIIKAPVLNVGTYSVGIVYFLLLPNYYSVRYSMYMVEN
jgi:hypothetical protein